MKKIFSFAAVVFWTLIFFASCKKENTLKNEGEQIAVQGNITLKIQAKHHYWGVSYLPLYLKKNSTTWPGTDSTKYEFKTIADDNGNCEFNHLFPGSYCVYGHGFDAIFGMNVIGYGPVELNAATAPDGMFNFTLNVSE